MALNNAWANSTLYGSIAGMDVEAFQAERPDFFPSLSRTLNHILEVDLYYFDVLTECGEGRRAQNHNDILDPGVLAAAQADIDMKLAMFVHNLSAGDLDAKRNTDRPSGQVEERMDSLLLHLFQHQIHHRGQAHVQLSHAGIEPPQLDEFHLEFERSESAKAYFN